MILRYQSSCSFSDEAYQKQTRTQIPQFKIFWSSLNIHKYHKLRILANENPTIVDHDHSHASYLSPCEKITLAIGYAE